MNKTIKERSKEFASRNCGCGICPMDEVCPRNSEIDPIGCDKYNKYQKIYYVAATKQREFDLQEFADRLTEMQGEYITLDLINELVKKLKDNN